VPEELQFVPFHASSADEGLVIELAIAVPEDPQAKAIRAATLERNPFAELDVETLAPGFGDPPETLVGADEICVATSQLTLVVGYPFAGQYAVTVVASTPKGFTRAELFRHLAHVYSTMYEGATYTAADRGRYTKVESPRFGTAWHRFDDLVVEEVVVERRSDGLFAWISIGS
jgi:hypothetical protein